MVGMLTNCLGIVFSKVIDEMGFGTDGLSLYYMLRSFASALSVFLAVQICAMLCFLFMAQIPAALYVGTVLYGTVYSVSVTTPSSALSGCLWAENYRGKVSRM